MIIALGTIISSLQSDRLTRRFGTGKVTAVSVGITAAALLGFSFTHSFWLLCLWAVPYGLGAGSVDASLNNYVALHYKSRHMSWLHCMWGIGATAGPYIMGLRSEPRTEMELRILLYCCPSDHPHRHPGLQPPSVERTFRRRRKYLRSRRKSIVSRRDHPNSGRQGDHAVLLLLLCTGTDFRIVGQQLSHTVQVHSRRNSRALCRTVLHRDHRRTRFERFPYHEAERCSDDPTRSGNHCSGNPYAFPARTCFSLTGRADPDRAGVRSRVSLYHPFHTGTLRCG